MTIGETLRQYDADLRLVPPGVMVDHGRELSVDTWRVYRYMGSDFPIQFVCGWYDEHGNPLPGEPSAEHLLNMVKALDMNTRFERESADARNAKLLADRKREADEAIDEIGKEFGRRISGKFSSPLKRGPSLYAARNRVRSKIKDNDLKP